MPIARNARFRAGGPPDVPDVCYAGQRGGSEPRHPDAPHRRGGDRSREEARRGDRDARAGRGEASAARGLFGAPAWLMLLRPPSRPLAHPAPCGFRIGRSASAAGSAVSAAVARLPYFAPPSAALAHSPRSQ